MAKTTIGKVIGTGLLAGLAGTALMTAAQLVEMRMRKRAPSTVPAKAIEKVFHIEARDDQSELRLANATHWAYGSGWGLARAVLRELGFAPAFATFAQLGLVWGTELRMLPGLKLAPPVRRWKKQEIAQDLALHALYATATGLAYDVLRSKRVARNARRARRALRAATYRLGRQLRGPVPGFAQLRGLLRPARDALF